MKKLNYLLVFFLVVSTALTSCKKDEEENNSTKILGKWNLKMEVEKEYVNNQLRSTEEDTFEAGAYVEFKSGGTLIWNEDGSSPETYSYRVDGNKLTLIEDADGDPEVFTILELTSSKLVISEEDIDVIGQNTIKESYELHLER